MKTHNRALFGKQTLTLALASLVLPMAARAQDEQAAELAKKLSNPVASLVSVPIQYNQDTYGGVNDDASVSRLTFLPVVPVSINENWNLITRTIFGVADNEDFAVPALNQHQSVLLAAGPDIERPDLGSWAHRPAAHSGRGRARVRQVGCRADGSGSEAKGGVDHGHSGRSYLVRSRQ
jgi:hypothetical protein